MTWQLVVSVLALVLLALAACKIPEPPRVSFGWLGLFCWLLVELFGHGLR